jgi:hypothetical protein
VIGAGSTACTAQARAAGGCGIAGCSLWEAHRVPWRVDASLLVHGTPADIEEVHRLKRVFRSRWIISRVMRRYFGYRRQISKLWHRQPDGHGGERCPGLSWSFSGILPRQSRRNSPGLCNSPTSSPYKCRTAAFIQPSFHTISDPPPHPSFITSSGEVFYAFLGRMCRKYSWLRSSYLAVPGQMTAQSRSGFEVWNAGFPDGWITSNVRVSLPR